MRGDLLARIPRRQHSNHELDLVKSFDQFRTFLGQGQFNPNLSSIRSTTANSVRNWEFVMEAFNLKMCSTDNDRRAKLADPSHL